MSEREGLISFTFTPGYLLKRLIIILSIVLSMSIILTYSSSDILGKINEIRTLKGKKLDIIRELRNRTLEGYQNNIPIVWNEMNARTTAMENALLKGIGGDESSIEEGFQSIESLSGFTLSLDNSLPEEDNFGVIIKLFWNIAQLHSYLNAKQCELDHTPSIMPAAGQIISDYGYRISPFTGKKSVHRGIDLACEMGTPLVAPAAGTVTDISINDLWGLNLTIDHGDGIKTQYGHLESVHVKKGERIVRRMVIAKSGRSGRSTGPHLHYQIWLNDTPVDPKIFVINYAVKG